MKVFFCIHSGSSAKAYRLLQISINSILDKNQNIDIYVLTNDSSNNKLLNCTTIEYKSSLYESLNRVYNDNPVIGTYYRFDIPKICAEYGFTDSYILYLDYDILCINDPIKYLENLKPTYLSCNLEWDRKNAHSMKNAGVMYLNIKNMIKVQDNLFEYLDHNMASFTHPNVHDQTAINKYFKDKIDLLPDELNWKSYWGINDNASIIHYHWIKPNEDITDNHKQLIDKAPAFFNLDSFNYYRNLWQNFNNSNI